MEKSITSGDNNGHNQDAIPEIIEQYSKFILLLLKINIGMLVAMPTIASVAKLERIEIYSYIFSFRYIFALLIICIIINLIIYYLLISYWADAKNSIMVDIEKVKLLAWFPTVIIVIFIIVFTITIYIIVEKNLDDYAFNQFPVVIEGYAKLIGNVPDSVDDIKRTFPQFGHLIKTLEKNNLKYEKKSNDSFYFSIQTIDSNGKIYNGGKGYNLKPSQ